MSAMEIIGTGNYMRSAEMEYFSLIMQEHLAHGVVERLGDMGCVQFTDVSVSSPLLHTYTFFRALVSKQNTTDEW